MASESGVEPPSGQKGAGTVDSPYDAGNAPENTSTGPTTTAAAPTDLESSSTTHQGSGLPTTPPTTAQAEKIVQSKETSEAAQQSPTSPASSTAAAKSTGLAADGGNFDAAKSGAGKEAARLRSLDRDVSPGTRDDGTHAETSGDRGENYEPSKFNKLKGKFHIGGR